MSKSILLVDTPNSCSECFKNNGYNLLCNKKLTGYDIDGYINKRHPKCPLQDTSKLLEKLESMNNHIETFNSIEKYYNGYDIIIEALGGKHD